MKVLVLPRSKQEKYTQTASEQALATVINSELKHEWHELCNDDDDIVVLAILFAIILIDKANFHLLAAGFSQR